MGDKSEWQQKARRDAASLHGYHGIERADKVRRCEINHMKGDTMGKAHSQSTVRVWVRDGDDNHCLEEKVLRW